MVDIVKKIFEQLKYSIKNFKEDPIKSLGYIFPFVIIIYMFIFSVVIFTSNNELKNIFLKGFLFLPLIHFVIILCCLIKNSTKNLRVLSLVALGIIIFQLLLFIIVYWFISSHTISQNSDLYNLLEPYLNVKVPIKTIFLIYIIILGIALLLYLFLLLFNKETREIIIYTIEVYVFLFILSFISLIVCIIKIISGSISLAGKISDKLEKERLESAERELLYAKEKHEKYSHEAKVSFEKASGDRLSLHSKSHNLDSAMHYSKAAEKEAKDIEQLEKEINILRKNVKK